MFIENLQIGKLYTIKNFPYLWENRSFTKNNVVEEIYPKQILFIAEKQIIVSPYNDSKKWHCVKCLCNQTIGYLLFEVRHSKQYIFEKATL